jgi:Fic family protein
LRKARFWMRNGQQPLNDRQRKVLNALLDAAPAGFTGGLSNRKYAHLTHASPATAQRDLADLVARSLLVASGGGRSVRYELAAPSS